MTAAVRAAMVVLGVSASADLDEVRTAYLARIRVAHPDAGGDPDEAAAITSAFELLRLELERQGCLPCDGPTEPTKPANPVGPVDAIEIDSEGDTIFVAAPPHETFQLLLDAAATIGGIGHVDRHLGLLEVIVRFEGGPSCSVLITLQGRAFGTDAFCTMESIEAAPTPPIAPVVEALVAAADHVAAP